MMPRTGLLGLIGVIGVIAVALTLVADRSDSEAFGRYFGNVPPVAVVIGVSALAYPLLLFLHGRDWALWSDSRTALVFVVVGATLLAALAIAADLVLRFPEDMNVPSPQALAFYPPMAWIIEVVMHALPLVILIAVFGSPDSVTETRFWLMAAAIALTEAILQALFATTAATAIFSGIHLLAIGMFQVYLFRRFGFIPMLAFRLAYYGFWHIAWGAARLPLLF